MIYLKNFKESSILTTDDPDMPTLNRSLELSEEDFLKFLHSNCKNFSFSNDLLWRGKPKKFDLELFTPGYRKAKASTFSNFFNEIESDPSYPVIRKKSLIGATNKKNTEFITSQKPYLVIPYDNSEIIFCPIIDLYGIQSNSTNQKLNDGDDISKEHFVKSSYIKDFKIPYDEVELIRSRYNLRGSKKTGYEFFTSSPCLLVHDSKIKWLESII